MSTTVNISNLEDQFIHMMHLLARGTHSSEPLHRPRIMLSQVHKATYEHYIVRKLSAIIPIQDEITF